MADLDRHRPGLRVLDWDLGLVIAFVAVLAGFAAALLTGAFTLAGTAKVITFVISVTMAVLAFTLLYFAANRRKGRETNGSEEPRGLWVTSVREVFSSKDAGRGKI